MMRFISLNLQPDVSNFSLQSFLFSVLNPAVTEGNRNCFHRYHVQVWATVLMLFILRQGNGALRKSPRGLCFGESKKQFYELCWVFHTFLLNVPVWLTTEYLKRTQNQKHYFIQVYESVFCPVAKRNKSWKGIVHFRFLCRC